MNYLIYGSDNSARQKEVNSIISDFYKKGFEPLRMGDVDFDESAFLNHILSDNLFGKRSVLVLSHCLSGSEPRLFLDSKRKEIEETETPIVFVESDFLKKDFPLFKKSFKEVREFKKVKSLENKRYNIFPLIEAVVSGNKKSGWLLLQDAIKAEVSAEEIFNLLFWQYKTLSLVSTGATAEDLKMKPFVYTKSKRLISRYSSKDLRQKMFTIIKLFQESRFEKDGFERLEKYILK
jgi:DNA polymerase III delta subunit